MSLTLDEGTRRRVGLALGNRNVANQLCDAVETSSAAVAGVDRFLLVPLPDLAAGEALEDVPLPPFEFGVTLMNLQLLALGAFAGVDAGDTIAVTVKDGDGNTIVAKTYSNSPAPTDNGANALGALNATNKILAAGESATIAVVCGATADPPAMNLLVRYRAT